MKYMNDYDIDEAWARWHSHPVLGPGIRTLISLKTAVDANSDGWAYWGPPVRAANLLMELITRDGTYAFDNEREDATPKELKKAYAVLKAFRTRSVKWIPDGLPFDIFEIGAKSPSTTRANDAPIRTKAEAGNVLDNIILGLASTDAYHNGDMEAVVAMFEQDVKTFLIGQIESLR